MYFIVTVNDNTNGNHRRIILNVKDTKLQVPVVALSAKDNQNYQNFLTKNLKDQIIGVNIKQKVRIKLQQISIDILSIQTLQDLTGCFCRCCYYCLFKRIR